MNKEKMPSKIRSLLIKKLKDYRFMQDELILIEEEIDSSSADANYYVKSKNKVSKKTENLGIRLAENERYQEIKAWKNCIDNLFISYNKNSLKWKFVLRRYIVCDTVLYKWNKNNELKDKDIYRDLQLEGINRDEKTFKRLKNDILNDLYKEAIKNNLINL